MNYPNNKIDIILLTCNRKDITKKTIEDLYERVNYPDKIRLIVVDDESVDGTTEMLRELKGQDLIDILIESKEHKNICMGYNEGFKHIKSEYFICMQDDITIPKLEPKDVIEQLIDFMEKYPDHGGIGCRIQHIPNMNWQPGDLTPARKSLSAYFRISRKSDFEDSENPFGRRDWDDQAFVSIIRNKKGMECSWANNLWCDHSRGYCEDRGYKVLPRKWGTGIHSRTTQSYTRKPYPKIDPLTNIPLQGEKLYR